jgi:hypothetical protein
MRHARLLGALFVVSFCACRSGPQLPLAGPPGLPSGGKLAVDPRRPPYQPVLPPALNRAGLVVAGTFLVCATPDGQVKQVSIIKSADPRVDADWMRTLKTWRYEPFVVAGNRLPLCHQVRLDVRPISG